MQTFLSMLYLFGEVLNIHLIPHIYLFWCTADLKCMLFSFSNELFMLLLKYNILVYIMSGAEISSSYQRCEWHNGCLCAVFRESEKHWYWVHSSVFPNVSWFSVSFQSFMGHSTYTTLDDFFGLPYANQNEVDAF